VTAQRRIECARDAPAVGALLKAAFEGGAEVDLVGRLRDRGDIRLALVAEQAGRVVGYAAFLRLTMTAHGVAVSAIGLAPLAVEPAWQRQGIGAALVREGLSRLKSAGERIAFVLGDPAYYARFGFKVSERYISRYSGPHFQALVLAPDAPLSGHVAYPDPFANLS
jgi:putative acetyltransferase